MAWFNFLKSEGYFDPEKNPEPIWAKQGFQVPFWEVLDYLEKLSIQISLGKEADLTDELLEIIKNVSEQPKDNYRTWYVFIKILTNLPNENVPTYILNYIPVWLSGKIDTMVQTSEICDKLLPKFLNEEPTKADIEKAELILHYLFQVEKIENQEDFWDGEGNSYRSRLSLHFLSEKFNKRNLAPKVAKHCSTKIILELGRTIKFLLLDYPKGVNTILQDNEKEYEIKIHIEKENLEVSSKLKNNDAIAATLTLENWESKSETELKEELVLILKKQNINYIPTEDNNDTFQSLNLALTTDISSAIGIKSIRKLDDRYSNKEKALNVLSIIFRDLLNEKAKQDPKVTIPLLKNLCNDKKYFIHFFKRITLYVISENWNTTKSLFWELLKGNDALHFFSTYQYQNELYDLLSRNQQALLKKEKEVLQKIIDLGDQVEVYEKFENHTEYWEHRWYAALKDIEPFKKKYLTLTEKLKITYEHYENKRIMRMRSGSVSPISMDDLLNKSNKEIVNYIQTFNPKDRWEDPNISGLSDILGSAVESEPEKFTDEIEFYQDIPYIYSYHLLNALGKAWRKQKKFNWEKVLCYCLLTLKSEKFYTGLLKVENDTWNASEDWVVGAIAELLTEGLQNDQNSFEITLLPLAKEIIQILIQNLKQVDDFEKANMDYPSYSFNSTAGKALKALFDYSLHRARNLFKYEDKGKWEPEMKSLFEGAIHKGILDTYILEGLYFEQFYFLDNDWITNQVKSNYEIEDKEWLAFIGSFAYGNPPTNEVIYNLFVPHYEKIIDKKITLQHFHENILVRHFVAFYFWKYETLSSEKLLFKFLSSSTPDNVSDLINYISQQDNYYKSLSDIELYEFQNLIFDLWKYLSDKYENSSIEEEQINLASLGNWIVYVPELNEAYTELILKSCKYIGRTYQSHKVLENLLLLKNKGNPLKIAKSISEIITSLNFIDYLADFNKESIKELVIFLFIYGQHKIAAEFCNNMAAVHQQFFLREIYDTYKKED